MLRKLPRVWILLLGWAATIFATSSTFIERSVFINFVERLIPTAMPRQLWVNFWASFGIFVVKAYHVAEFALLCWLAFTVLQSGLVKNRKKALVAAAGVSALYAISDEWHQTFVPGRGGTWVDVLIDCIGIGLAVALTNRQTAR